MSNQPGRIFLLSHMRAYSSLIGHILGSHPDINGYYEMHISYESRQSLCKQEQAYCQQETIKPCSLYLFDKLLHNNYALDLMAIEQSHPKVLMTIRAPEPSIKSIINLFQKKPQQTRYSKPDEATKYYIQRLQKLSEFCLQNSQRYFYFDAELIQSSTPQMLATLTGWLQLNAPLSSQYQLFSKTGKARAGDSSNNIKTGEVVKCLNNYSNIHVSDELLEQATLAYQKSRSIMIKQSIAHKTI